MSVKKFKRAGARRANSLHLLHTATGPEIRVEPVCAPCGCEALAPTAWLREFVCVNGHAIARGQS